MPELNFSKELVSEPFCLAQEQLILARNNFLDEPVVVASHGRHVDVVAVVERDQIVRNAVVEEPVLVRAGELDEGTDPLRVVVDRKCESRGVARDRDGRAVDVAVDALRNRHRLAAFVRLLAQTGFSWSGIINLPEPRISRSLSTT